MQWFTAQPRPALALPDLGPANEFVVAHRRLDVPLAQFPILSCRCRNSADTVFHIRYRGVNAKEPTPKLMPSYRLALLRDGLQDNALWRFVQAGVDDAGRAVRVPETVRRALQSHLDATFINPVQWRVSRPHHQAWRQELYEAVMRAGSGAPGGS